MASGGGSDGAPDSNRVAARVSTAARSLTLIQRTLSQGSQNLAGTRVCSFLPTLGRGFGSSKTVRVWISFAAR